MPACVNRHGQIRRCCGAVFLPLYANFGLLPRAASQLPACLQAAEGTVSPLPGAASQTFNLGRGSFAFGEATGFFTSGRPLQFLRAPLCGTRENCKERVFAQGNKISQRKNRPIRDVHEAILPLFQTVKIGRLSPP